MKVRHTLQYILLSIALCLISLHSAAQDSCLSKSLLSGPKQANAACVLEKRFKYVCGEKHDSLCFELVDLETKTAIAPQKMLYALKYDAKNHNRQQSFQLLVDTGNSIYKNRVYIAWADQKNGINNWDVFLIYSDDAGLHWTEPILITYAPNHKSQWAPKLNINPLNGQLSLLYFDCAYSLKSKLCHLTLAQSNNGGLKWDYYKLSDHALPCNDKKLANGFYDDKNQIYAAWSCNAEKSHCRIPLNNASLQSRLTKTTFNQLSTNTWLSYADSLILDINCSDAFVCDIELSKPITPQFPCKKIMTTTLAKGNNRLLIDMKRMGFENANYVLTLYYKGTNKFIWITTKE